MTKPLPPRYNKAYQPGHDKFSEQNVNALVHRGGDNCVAPNKIEETCLNAAASN